MEISATGRKTRTFIVGGRGTRTNAADHVLLIGHKSTGRFADALMMCLVK